MKTIKLIFILAIAFSLLLNGCVASNDSDASDPSSNNGHDTGSQNGNNAAEDDGNDIPNDNESGNIGQPDDDERIKNMISNMGLHEKIGQMFMIGIEETAMNDDLENYIKERFPGGSILFGRNSQDPDQLLELINSLKKVNSGRIPLFVSVDEEGGSVSRMPSQLHELPSAWSIGELDDDLPAYELGSLLAQKIEIFGFNMDFAPVLDIWSNPKNTVIGERAFGTTAEIVSRHGIPLMKGIRENGVIPVVKHFPGHGDTETDSHVGLPAVSHDIESLNGFELVPFKKAIEENADAVMIAHILMNRIDPKNPASLSETVISKLLREEMGFEGVVITDDMTMGAITKNYDIGEAAVRSIIAGSDIILVCHGYDKQAEAIDAVRQSVESGLIDQGRIDKSVARILKLKDKYGLTDEAVDYADVDVINEKIDGFLSQWYNR